jgi:hypothetical protein
MNGIYTAHFALLEHFAVQAKYSIFFRYSSSTFTFPLMSCIPGCGGHVNNRNLKLKEVEGKRFRYLCQSGRCQACRGLKSEKAVETEELPDLQSLTAQYPEYM